VGGKSFSDNLGLTFVPYTVLYMRMNEKKELKRVVYLVQIGTAGYRVERTTNFIDQPLGVTIPKTQVEEFQRQGVTVTISRNK
jgi:hypothetical protein